MIVFVFLTLAGCIRYSDGKEHRRHVIAKLMDSAEVIMNDNPELALRLMDSIDSRSISGRECNTLLWLRNYTRGNNERPFIIDDNGEIIWW